MADSEIERPERTFVMIKPDGVQRGYIGECIKRFEEKGFKLVAMKFLRAEPSVLYEHYLDLSTKPFFPDLLKYMTSGPVCPMVWEGVGVIKGARMLLGETDPSKSRLGTIRGDLSVFIGRNVIHGADCLDNAQNEIALWFKQDELVKWESIQEPWVYGVK